MEQYMKTEVNKTMHQIGTDLVKLGKFLIN